MAADCRRVFGERFVALVASTSHSAVAFTTSIRPGDLEALAPLTASWERDALDPPLLLTPDELRRSLDSFPLEYHALLARHVVIDGTPPFEGIAIERAHLRRACEVQAKSHLIHLRQGWVQAGPGDLAALLLGSAPPLRALLANIAELTGAGTPDDPLAGARVAGLDVELAREILALEEDEAGARRLTARLPDYLALSEQLWGYIDSWSSP